MKSPPSALVPVSPPTSLPAMYSAILANVARHITLTPDEAAIFTALLTP